MSTTAFLIILLLACTACLLVPSSRRVPNFTKRDFGWLGWKPTHLHNSNVLYEEATRAIASDALVAGEAVVVCVDSEGHVHVVPVSTYDDPNQFKEVMN